MQKYNKIFENIAKLIEMGLVSSKDLKKEIENFIHFRTQSIINKFNLPSREEFEVLKKRLENFEKQYLKKKSKIKRRRK